MKLGTQNAESTPNADLEVSPVAGNLDKQFQLERFMYFVAFRMDHAVSKTWAFNLRTGLMASREAIDTKYIRKKKAESKRAVWQN